MKTQISRDGFNAGKRYSGVYQQQGRMITDRDWNELMDVVKARLDAALYDVFGSGSPRTHGAQVQKDTPQSAVRLRPGPVYVDGVGALLAPAPGAPAGPTIAFDQQAGFPTPPALPAAGQVYLLYADVWERAVTSLEDPGLRDPALQGADTCTRTQPLAQIKWCQGKDPENPLHNPRQGNATLTAVVPQGTGESAADPCDPTLAEVDPLGNDHLFRLEVHNVVWPPNATPVPETPDRVVIKWSRENGAEQQEFDAVTDDFKAPPFLFELYQTAAEEHLGLHLVPGGGTPRRGTLVAPFPAAPPASTDTSPFFARRWDGSCVLLRLGNNTWQLGTGPDDPQTTAPGATVAITNSILSIKLAALELSLDLQGKVFLPGDFWLVPVRVATHDPGAVLLDHAAPQGIVHRYLTLAQVDANGSLHPQSTTENRRRAFPRLTELTAVDVSYQTLCPPGSLLTAAQDTVQKALDQICSLAAQNVAFTKSPPDTGVFKGKNPHTVAEALTLLCNVSADQVAYSKAQFPAVQDVKAGLDELFGRPVGGSGRISVGVGGQYATLALAMADLAGTQQRADIALALMPGDHQVAFGANLGSFPSLVNLSLVGAGNATRVFTQSNLVFSNLASFSLVNVAVTFLSTNLSLTGCRDVVLVGNRLGGSHTSNALVTIGLAERVLLRDNWIDVPWRATDPGFKTILMPPQTLGGVADIEDLFGTSSDAFTANTVTVVQAILQLPLANRVSIYNNILTLSAQAGVSNEESTAYKAVGIQLANNNPAPTVIAAAFRNLRTVLHLKNPATALVLADALAPVELVGNHIVGFVGLYGEPGGIAGLVPNESEGAIITVLAGRLHLSALTGTLRLANNTLTGIRVVKSMVDGIRTAVNTPNGTITIVSAFESLELFGNILEKGDSQLVADHVGLHSNSFTRLSENVGWVLATSAVYMGNRAIFSGSQFSLWSAVRSAAQTDLGNLMFTLVKT